MVDISLSADGDAAPAASFLPIRIAKLLNRLAAIENEHKRQRTLNHVSFRWATDLSDDAADSIHIFERSMSGGALPHHQAEYSRLAQAAEAALTRESRDMHLKEANWHFREFHRFRNWLITESTQYLPQLHRHAALRAEEVEAIRKLGEGLDEFIKKVSAATSRVRDIGIEHGVTGWLSPAVGGPAILVNDLLDCLLLFFEGQKERDAEKVERSRFTRLGKPVSLDLFLHVDDDDGEAGSEGGEPELALWP